ncbi:hypothetical protein J3B02_002675 [Coemansia erecta]|nr:hypothetical protein J3B02_002675 [Coemansia erecta]
MSTGVAQASDTFVSIFGMPGSMAQQTSAATSSVSNEQAASGATEQSTLEATLPSARESLPITNDIPDIIGGAYLSSDAAQQSSLASEFTSEEGQLESEAVSSELSLDVASEIEGEQSGSSEDSDYASELGGFPILGPETSETKETEATGSFVFINPFSEPEQSVAETETASSDEGSALPGLESGFDLASEMPMDTAEMTMASVPLPYPPFGGPEQQQQQQQPTMSEASEALIEAASTNADSSAATAEPTDNDENVIETINIVGAPNQNALESSIDAILHSVLEEYESESTPKAAVGFALIHARRQAMSSGSAE